MSIPVTTSTTVGKVVSNGHDSLEEMLKFKSKKKSTTLCDQHMSPCKVAKKQTVCEQRN